MSDRAIPEEQTTLILPERVRVAFKIVKDKTGTHQLSLRGPGLDKLRQDPTRILVAYYTALNLDLPLTARTRTQLKSAAHLLRQGEPFRIYHDLWRLLVSPRATGTTLRETLTNMNEDGVLSQALLVWTAPGEPSGTLATPMIPERSIAAAGHAYALRASTETVLAVLLYVPDTEQAEQNALTAAWRLVHLRMDARTIGEIGRLILHQGQYPETHLSDDHLYQTAGLFRPFWPNGIDAATAHRLAHPDAAASRDEILAWREEILTRTRALISARGLPEQL